MGKEKSKEKIKLPLQREFSAGGVVFKKKGQDFLWLMIQPQGTDRWQLPKGHLDGKEKSSETALREVEEEGLIEAKIVVPLKKIQYFFVLDGKKIFKVVTFFLMQYLKDSKKELDTKEIAKVAFVKYQEALEKLTFKSEKELLREAFEKVNQGIQEILV